MRLTNLEVEFYRKRDFYLVSIKIPRKIHENVVKKIKTLMQYCVFISPITKILLVFPVFSIVDNLFITKS